MGTLEKCFETLERFLVLEYSKVKSFQNLSRNLSKFWNNKNLSKKLKSFQTLILCGVQGCENLSRNLSSRVYARARPRNYMEKYIPIGYIYFSNVISLEELKSFQKSKAKNCYASPCPPCGAARCNFSAVKSEVLQCG